MPFGQAAGATGEGSEADCKVTAAASSKSERAEVDCAAPMGRGADRDAGWRQAWAC